MRIFHDDFVFGGTSLHEMLMILHFRMNIYHGALRSVVSLFYKTQFAYDSPFRNNWWLVVLLAMVQSNHSVNLFFVF